MFLKRIEIQGFKSFADKTIISFDSDVVGIVGPNGCGKSNINDAIRWVLGEQSVKMMRASNMSDVIFSGSVSRKPLNLAEVTLVFDNSLHHLHIDYEEVEITRRLHRANNEAEYLLNKTPCRLKDIQTLILDTGLGRDSLSIISQGTVSSFVDSKPEDRRALFEEAAGVAKYKKRKMESLGKLNRTQENLDRLKDIIEELQRQVNPLRRQAEKAEKYLQLKGELETIEITVLVDEIEHLNQKIEECKSSMFEIDSKKALHEATIALNENRAEEYRSEMSLLDREINQLQEKFMKVVNEIQGFEARKIELDEKRKYALETADRKQKAKELKLMLDEANYELEDRQERLEVLENDLQLAKDQLEMISQKMASNQQKLNERKNLYTQYQNRSNVLSNLIQQPFNHQQGVASILRAKESLMGVIDVVSKALKPQDGYEIAVSNAIGGALYNIITEDEMSARNAINFLKKNQGGRATFLPLSVMKERYLTKEQYFIAKDMVGYLGCANEFVDCDETVRIVCNSLLGNVIVCDQLINANEIASALKHQVKIVTLDGDIVHRGGSMTGGKAKENYSVMTLEKEKQKVDASLEKLNSDLQILNENLTILNRKQEELQERIVQIRIDMAKLQPIVDAKASKVAKLKAEYEECDPQGLELGEVNEDDNLVIQLSKAYSLRDSITSDIQSKRSRRLHLGEQSERNEMETRTLRRECNELLSRSRDLEVEKARAETLLESDVSRLNSSYEMTYEYALTQKVEMDIAQAKNDVVKYRQQINALGNVNLDAPKEYQEVRTRYDFLISQKADLESAKGKIMEAIDEMDDVMKQQFKEMFDKINGEFNDIFRTLFGGGRASLVLVDPDDILNTGIDIDVQPPGKNVVNIRALSGGEKSLTAICALFAILKARVVPLCIFDEVEAALDQANVERFAKYIKHFRGTTQFIVVTHRPGTMAECDALYGVTMKQNGISSLLKVQLQEAMKYADKKEVSA